MGDKLFDTSYLRAKRLDKTPFVLKHTYTVRFIMKKHRHR